LESRKNLLQRQIIDALKANDNDLYSLLKSQWAHRFGVESLEELKSLDLNQLNQNLTSLDNQKIDQLQEKFSESDKTISNKDDDNREKEIKDKELELIKNENHKSTKSKSYEIVDKENYENKPIYRVNKKHQPEVNVLIPLPPKPKYSYLKKWLLKK